MKPNHLIFLHKNSYFSSFSQEEIARFSTHLQETSFKDGSSLFVEGANDFGWYILIEGSIVILRDSKEGPPHTLAELTPGEAFGEMALIENTPRMASAIALGDVKTLRLDSVVFKRLLKEKNDVAIGLLFQMAAVQCSRLRQITTILQKITDEKLVQAEQEEQNIDINTAIRHRYLSTNH